jgi:hypothetical protein
MAAFRQGNLVKLIQPVIQGTVVRRDVIEDVDMYLVTWIDAVGETQERYFPEDQLEVA